jgi:hypothetical protein
VHFGAGARLCHLTAQRARNEIEPFALLRRRDHAVDAGWTEGGYWPALSAKASDESFERYLGGAVVSVGGDRIVVADRGRRT